jgi:hypothetical protein
MGMADMGHVVVAVEIGAAIVGPQPDAVAAHDVERLGVEQQRLRAHRPLAPLQQGVAALAQLRREPDRLQAQLPQRFVAALEGGEQREAAGPLQPIDRFVGRGAARVPQPADHGTAEQPDLHELGHQLGLVRLQRGDEIVAAQHRGEDVRGIAGPGQAFGNHDGGIQHQGAVHHVAEIDDARDAPALVDQHVPGVDIGMDDLGAERPQLRPGDRDEPLQEMPGGCFPLRAQPRQMRQHLVRPHHVPDDVAAGDGGVGEAAQCLAEPRHDRAERAEIHRARLGEQRAVLPLQQQRRVFLVAMGDARDELARPRGRHARHRQGRIDHGDMLEPQRLGLGQRESLALRHDLQQAPSIGGVDPHVLVAVARNRQQRTVDPIGAAEVLPDRLLRQSWRNSDGNRHLE